MKKTSLLDLFFRIGLLINIGVFSYYFIFIDGLELIRGVMVGILILVMLLVDSTNDIINKIEEKCGK